MRSVAEGITPSRAEDHLSVIGGEASDHLTEAHCATPLQVLTYLIQSYIFLYIFSRNPI